MKTHKKPPPAIPPEFIRLPKDGTLCRYTGLSRSGMNQLILPSKLNGYNPPVNSFIQKTNPHTIRGVRLIVYESLIAYLRQQMRCAEKARIEQGRLRKDLEAELEDI